MLCYCRVVTPCAASDKDFKQFHSADYIECLQAVCKNGDAESMMEKLEEFGLGDKSDLCLLGTN